MRPTLDDDDPTGVRALLRALPDPDPMADDLVARIRATCDGLDTPPVARRPRRYAGHLAIAATLLVVGGFGAVLLVRTPWIRAVDPDDAFVSQTTGRGPVAETRSDTGEFIRGPITRAVSERHLDSLTLTSALSALATPSWVRTTSSGPTRMGSLSTDAGSRSCLTGLGLPEDAAATINFVNLDDEPSALIVVRRASGERTAYLVGRGCHETAPALRRGPLHVA